MTIIEKIIAKHQEDREIIKAMKARHAEELRVVEEFQAKREAALLEHGDITCFEYMVDLFINGRDGKAETEKKKANIALDQAKIEAWLLKMLNGVGEGIKTSAGTVYRTRKESITCSDFDMFVDSNMLKDAARALFEDLAENGVDFPPYFVDNFEDEFIKIIHENMHLEYLNKALNKTAILELMGEPAKDGSRPNTPPAGVSYVALQTVGVRKAK